MLRLYPARYNQAQALLDESIDVHNLANLCSDVRASLRRSLFQDWSSIPTFLPLVLERLLSCTGDPMLRLDACWDRRPRGTFLDFGWTRVNPNMPNTWSFFAHCNPENLLTCAVEITEVVAGIESLLRDTYAYPSRQPWKFVTTGDILRALYVKRILVQPQPQDKKKYAKHILYIIAATELLNTFCKSEKIDLETFEKISLSVGDDPRTYEVQRLGDFNTEALLKRPLSDIASKVLSKKRPPKPNTHLRRVDRSSVFDPRHLKLELLTGLGALKVEWTEYLDQHLIFEPPTLTVYIYWFASHVRDNAMFQ
jgi:hypothetical protein